MDTAFAKILADEFVQLTAGMMSSQTDNWLRQSEQCILRLRNGSDMPDYSDSIVVLWYAIQYQMGHINLAYTLIKVATDNNQLTGAGRLQVADFDAGRLAMQFGLALAVADALECDERIAGVWLDAIDTGLPMMELGKRLWQVLASEVGSRAGLHFLTEAAHLIQWHGFHEQHHSVRKLTGMNRWVSALHTLYEGSESEVGSALSDLCDTLDPDRVLVTSYRGKLGLAEQVLPPGWDWGDGKEPRLRWAGFIDDSRAARVASELGFGPGIGEEIKLCADVRGAGYYRRRKMRPSDSRAHKSERQQRRQ